MMKKGLLSKSKYLNGLQCPKYLWLLFNDKKKVPHPDISTQYAFDEGHRIGELAKRLFPDGIDTSSDDFIGNLNKTRDVVSFMGAGQSEQTLSFHRVCGWP